MNHKKNILHIGQVFLVNSRGGCFQIQKLTFMLSLKCNEMHVKPNAVLLGEGSTVVATGIIFYATFVSTSMFKLDDAARRVFVRIRG